jgi:hypothetical protein
VVGGKHAAQVTAGRSEGRIGGVVVNSHVWCAAQSGGHWANGVSYL